MAEVGCDIGKRITVNASAMRAHVRQIVQDKSHEALQTVRTSQPAAGHNSTGAVIACQLRLDCSGASNARSAPALLAEEQVLVAGQICVSQHAPKALMQPWQVFMYRLLMCRL